MSDIGQNHPEEHLIIPEPLVSTETNVHPALPRKRTRQELMAIPGRYKKKGKVPGSFARILPKRIHSDNINPLHKLPYDMYRKILTYKHTPDVFNSVKRRIVGPYKDQATEFTFVDNGVTKTLNSIPQRSNQEPKHKYSNDKPPNKSLFQFLSDDPETPQWFINTTPAYQLLGTPFKHTYTKDSAQSIERKNRRKLV